MLNLSVLEKMFIGRGQEEQKKGSYPILVCSFFVDWQGIACGLALIHKPMIGNHWNRSLDV